MKKKKTFFQWLMGQIIMVMGMESEGNGQINLGNIINRTCHMPL